MNKLEYNINSTPCVLFFGYSCFKKLSEMWGVLGYKGVLDKLSSFGELTEDVSFDQMEMLGDIIEASLKSNPEKQPEFDREIIMNDLMVDLLKVVEVVKALMAATQKPQDKTEEEPGKKKADVK